MSEDLMYRAHLKYLVLSVFFILSIGLSPISVNSETTIQQATVNRVFVITIDGLRYDTFDSTDNPELPGFDWLLDHGLKIDTIVPNPTLTATGHVSISAGANASVHGIMGNTFYDWQDNQSYSLFDSETDPYRNTTTAAHSLLSTQGYHWAPENGKESMTVAWAYSDGSYQGMAPTVNLPYGSVGSLQDPFIADAILGALDDNPNIALTYARFNGIDNPTHYDGVNSNRYNFNLGKTDEALLTLFGGLKERGMLETSTFFFLGDHGFSGIDDTTFFIEQTTEWTNALTAIGGQEPIIADDGGFVYLYWPSTTGVDLADLESFRDIIETHDNVEAVYINEEHEPLGLYNEIRGMNMSIWMYPNITRNFGTNFVNQHGYLNHHATMKSALLVAGAGIDASSSRTDGFAIDVTPTALDLLDLPALPDAQGVIMTDILADVAGLTGDDLPIEEPSSSDPEDDKSDEDDSPVNVFVILSTLIVATYMAKYKKKQI